MENDHPSPLRQIAADLCVFLEGFPTREPHWSTLIDRVTELCGASDCEGLVRLLLEMRRREMETLSRLMMAHLSGEIEEIGATDLELAGAVAAACEQALFVIGADGTASLIRAYQEAAHGTQERMALRNTLLLTGDKRVAGLLAALEVDEVQSELDDRFCLHGDGPLDAASEREESITYVRQAWKTFLACEPVEPSGRRRSA